MKTSITLLLSFSFGVALSAQRFTRLSNSVLSARPGDSRSVNLVDLNGDGLDDVFISKGLKGGQNNDLYFNQGKGRFLSITTDSITLDHSPSDGASFADVDNDGDLDAYVTTWYRQPNLFYLNDGRGNFSLQRQLLSGGLGTYSETAAWGDYDNDGWVDLYVTNSAGDQRNLLYHNRGDQQFERIQLDWLEEALPSRAASWADYDNDGDLDLFVANEEAKPNSLFQNQGKGHFVRQQHTPGAEDTLSSVTASWGDVNNDGWLDLFIGNAAYLKPQPNELWLNDGRGGFVPAPLGPIQTDGGCSFGSAFADYDNDGDLDLFVSNGYCTGEIRNFLYRNRGDGRFERDLQALPDDRTPCSFGTAWADLNQDGFLDVVVATCKNEPQSPEPTNLVYLNRPDNQGWVQLLLQGTRSNRAAIGAKVRIRTTVAGKTTWQLREVSAQTGYAGQNSLWVHFGIGSARRIEELVVEWPSGLRQQFQKVRPQRRYHLIENGPLLRK